jgi:predicted phage baseplate assembly protein
MSVVDGNGLGRFGDFHAFVEHAAAQIGREPAPDGSALARVWDVEGDPHASLLLRLWAFVADGVAAYSELTAAEGYIGTARHWDDVRRLAALVAYRPSPRVAAQGWVRAEVEKDAAPVVPAGTRVQAAATADRDAQTYEVAEDTQLRGDWDGLQATWPLAPAGVTGTEIRFGADPDLRAGDRILLVSQKDGASPTAVVTVTDVATEIGTWRVGFDRPLATLLPATRAPHLAYRVAASAASARRLTGVMKIDTATKEVDKKAVVPVTAYDLDPVAPGHVVLETLLEELSPGRAVAVVDWQEGTVALTTVAKHAEIDWPVAPGATARVSYIELSTKQKVATGKDAQRAVTLYVVGDAVAVVNYALPAQPPGALRLRLHPRPAAGPSHLAVETAGADGAPAWEVFACSAVEDATQPGGLVVAIDRPPAGRIGVSRASGNVFRVRHGSTASARLGSSGDARASRQTFRVPDAPVAYDVDVSGAPVSSLEVRVDGVRWDERPTLFQAGDEPVYRTRLDADGGVVLEFGDGTRGRRLPTGDGNVVATYRVGGGVEGEVEGGAITALLGSVRGVKKISGAGATFGGADQDDVAMLRRLAPARARASSRVVSLADAADVALGYPGVTHAAAWRGPGPTGCPCGGDGVHVAFVRVGAAGPKEPELGEIALLRRYLDARRDSTIGICVCAGAVTRVDVRVTLAVDPRRVADEVAAAVRAAIADPEGPLAPAARELGQPLDPSDVYPVVHAVAGVVGVADLSLGGSGAALESRRAARHELVLPKTDEVLTAVPR